MSECRCGFPCPNCKDMGQLLKQDRVDHKEGVTNDKRFQIHTLRVVREEALMRREEGPFDR